jgi:hypothetical protein
MTLVELVVSVTVIGLLATVIAAAVTVTFRQELDTEGRLRVARWEQSLGMWLPADLASSGLNPPPDADPGTTPCGSGDCLFGSNALQLAWDDGSGPTTVAYRYGPSGDGTTFELIRVECSGGSCHTILVLRDLLPPSDPSWSPGDPIPSSVIDVAVPLSVTETDVDCTVDCGERSLRVIVNVNGAPGVDGVDRSSRVSYTAGGAVLGDLEPATFEGPSFLNAASGCGGPITLIVDESGSIGGQDVNVRAGVRSFVRAFEGTPTQLQIVEMFTTTDALGSGAAWNRFFDLSEPADVDALIGADGNSGLVSNIRTRSSPAYYTNWEDALFRTFHYSDGQTYTELGNPTIPPPELVVFFTDGLPTRDRAQAKSDGSALGPPSVPARFDHTGTPFSPRGWYRADYFADQFRDIRMIGVGVGNAFSNSTTVSHAGWPAAPIPNEVFLGDLVAGNDPSLYDGTVNYVKREYIAGSWGDVSTADLLVTSDFTQFGSALTEIALAECGGTLTVQTRELASGDPAQADVTYQVGVHTVTTSRVAKSGTFNIAFGGVASDTVDLIPQSLDGTGYAADSWSCRSGGADMGGAYSQIDAGDPAAGVQVTVTANQAVSCTLLVVPA